MRERGEHFFSQIRTFNLRRCFRLFQTLQKRIQFI
ncbi:unnamed protein product [Brassica oleracea var. botrytis]